MIIVIDTPHWYHYWFSSFHYFFFSILLPFYFLFFSFHLIFSPLHYAISYLYCRRCIRWCFHMPFINIFAAIIYASSSFIIAIILRLSFNYFHCHWIYILLSSHAFVIRLLIFSSTLLSFVIFIIDIIYDYIRLSLYIFIISLFFYCLLLPLRYYHYIFAVIRLLPLPLHIYAIIDITFIIAIVTLLILPLFILLFSLSLLFFDISLSSFLLHFITFLHY